MTIDEFMALDAHYRDAVVAERIFGFRPAAGWFKTKGVPVLPRTYTTSIADAWEVVEHCAPCGWTIIVSTIGDSNEARIDRCAMRDPAPGPRYVQVAASTIPLAICIAALRAVGAISD